MYLYTVLYHFIFVLFQYGIIGHFWFAAGASVHIFLFAIVAAEIRIKAPGAKTFLQVFESRLNLKTTNMCHSVAVSLSSIEGYISHVCVLTQVIYHRYGAVPHVTVMVFAFIANIVISGMIMYEGTIILSELTVGKSLQFLNKTSPKYSYSTTFL